MDDIPTPDGILTRIAEQQHGLVTRRQAAESGLDRASLRRRIERGDWTPIGPRVLRRTGSPPSVEMSALAGALDAGPSAYLAVRSAAGLWGVPGFRVEPIEVISLRHRRLVDPLATIHLPRHLPDPFAAKLRGVPVVRPALVLLQIAPLVHPDRLKRIMDWFWSRRLLSGPSASAELSEVMHRGRPGTAALRALLEGLPPDYVPPASGLESRFERIVTDHDLPRMRRQVDLGDDQDWCGRVDFLGVDVPLVVEVDSEKYHASLSSTADDIARQARLEAAGFRVERVTEFEVWHRANAVASRLRKAAWELRAWRAA